MSDNTNDTYVDEDAFGTPCLWLRTPGTGTPATPALLLTRDDVRAAVNLHKPNAHWGQASRDVHVDRLWDAIASTVRPSVGESARAESAPVGEAAIDALVTEFAPWDGIIQRQRLRAFADRVLEVRGQQPGVPVEKVREIEAKLHRWAKGDESQCGNASDAYTKAAVAIACLLPGVIAAAIAREAVTS